jgi:hypothetical protein
MKRVREKGYDVGTTLNEGSYGNGVGCEGVNNGWMAMFVSCEAATEADIERAMRD